MTGPAHAPYDTLKPIADGIWIIDGAPVRSNWLMRGTRATVVKLHDGSLWVYAPTTLTTNLQAELDALGPVKHLIVPNTKYLTVLPVWQATYMDAIVYGAPGVPELAEGRAERVRVDCELDIDQAEAEWDGQLGQMLVRGSWRHREMVFFHHDSATLILADLIQAHDTNAMPAWMRPIVWLAGTEHTDGKMPYLMARGFNREALEESVEKLIAFAPERVILSQGHWYQSNGTAELQRAFRRLVGSQQWLRALTTMERMRNHKSK
ncbi:DUF4336 domain-containing protein [Roseovarius sp. EL26]|uniref:DUF4336 domain-containing protein n=1 Tax=Roseovarius sp. EL26 TaxID=2126672 RepID=UPI000EA1F640|nr:DUF4336 domain-containing protein [Roseovarius sp. EL26]